MLKTLTLAAITATLLATTAPAQAWIIINGLSINGGSLNGTSAQGVVVLGLELPAK